MTQHFQQAVALWNELRDSEDETTFEAFESAERVILQHSPSDDEEAAHMLLAVEFNRATGDRFDGLDRVAAESVMRWRAIAPTPQSGTDV